MKEVRIKATPPTNVKGAYQNNRKYTVFLSPDNISSFKSRYDAESYAAMVTKNLNEFLKIANVAYADLFKIYRTVFLFIDTKTDKSILEICDRLNANFNLVYIRPEGSIFPTCFSIYQDLTKMCDLLKKFLASRKYFTNLYLCNAVGVMLQSNSFAIQILKSHSKEQD
jgi:hypothetical protein